MNWKHKDRPCSTCGLFCSRWCVIQRQIKAHVFEGLSRNSMFSTRVILRHPWLAVLRLSQRSVLSQLAKIDARPSQDSTFLDECAVGKQLGRALVPKALRNQMARPCCSAVLTLWQVSSWQRSLQLLSDMPVSEVGFCGLLPFRSGAHR